MARARAAAALGVAVAAISWAAVLYRLAGVPGGEAAWWRLLTGSAFTLAACGLAGCRGGRWLPLSLLAGAALALHFVSWFESLRLVSVAVSTSVVVTYPVFILLFERLFESVEITPARVLGVAAALAGVALMAEPWRGLGGGSVEGVGLAFLGSFAGAVYFYSGRIARRMGADTLSYTLTAYTAALAFVTAYLALAGRSPLLVPRRSIPYLLALGLVPMIGGHTLLNYALKYYHASLVTTLTLLEPFGASALALLVLGEKPPEHAVPGAALAALGSMAVTSSFRQERPPG
ncbi:DMT family transporter [Stetteria hydrogenophila]